MLVLTPERRRAALQERYPRWEPATISASLDRAAERYGDRPLVVTDERTYTYAETRDWSRSLARGLIARGVEPGDHVAVVMANYPEFVAVKYAIARVGATAVPVNFLLRRAELSYILRQSRSRVLVTMDAFRDLDYLAELDAIVPGWETEAGGDALPDLRDVFVFSPTGAARDGVRTLDDLAILGAGVDERELAERERAGDPDGYSDIVYTSGTTGHPKGVLLTHDMVLRTAYACAHTRAFEDARRITFALPMYHVFGYVECLVACTFVGGAIVPQTQFDAAGALTAIERHRATEIVCVPMMTLKILDEACERAYDLESLNAVFSSGGASPPTIWGEILSVLGAAEVLTAYGMSETTASTTCTLPEDPQERLLTSNGRLKPAGVAGDPSIGGFLALYKTIDPETGADLPRGEIGELMARGPSITPGYFDKPEETEAAFDSGGWLHTGDVGVIGADDYLVLTGRIKETYRCGGEMVMPREVEAVLAEHPAVAEAHVVGLPDPRMGEIGCACVVVAGDAAPDPRELIALCADRLARFKVPRHVVFVRVDELPLTATGRVQKFRLVELVAARVAAQPKAEPVTR